MAHFDRAALGNIDVHTAIQLPPNQAVILSLIEVKQDSQHSTFYGVVRTGDPTAAAPTAFSYVPFVAVASPLAASTTVTLHQDAATADLKSAVTASVGLIA